MSEVTEREGLSLKIRSTVQFEFGTLCDLIDEQRNNGKLSHETARHLKSSVRNKGNNILRVVDNHLEHVNVSRNYANEEINTARVKRRISERLKLDGNDNPNSP
ncbi:MAG: hypothetical protein NVSMB14_01430 [Isosphaeraceae bacterium]